jgi:hypothetical protein
VVKSDGFVTLIQGSRGIDIDRVGRFYFYAVWRDV